MYTVKMAKIKIIITLLFLSSYSFSQADIDDVEKEWRAVKACAIIGCIVANVSLVMHILDVVRVNADERESARIKEEIKTLKGKVEYNRNLSDAVIWINNHGEITSENIGKLIAKACKIYGVLEFDLNEYYPQVKESQRLLKKKEEYASKQLEYSRRLNSAIVWIFKQKEIKDDDLAIVDLIEKACIEYNVKKEDLMEYWPSDKEQKKLLKEEIIEKE